MNASQTDFGPHMESEAAKRRTRAVGNSSDLIQWAGGLHQRRDFNKYRDPISNWTEVYFHHQ